MEQKMAFNRICTMCKRHIQVNRGQRTDAVLFDGKVYHADCFLATKAVIKKCAYCGKNIPIQSDADFKGIARLGTKFYHRDCLLKNCSEKKGDSWRYIADNIEDYIEDARVNISSVSKKRISALNNIEALKDKFQQEVADKFFAESDLMNFIRERYDVGNVPPTTYRTIKALDEGTYKNNTIRIPVPDLYDMWQRKFDYLNQTYLLNKSRGKDMEYSARINYDIAILANKYDSYVKWKRRQQIHENEVTQVRQERKQDTEMSKVLESYSKHASLASKEESDDIDDLINGDFYTGQAY